MLGQRSLVGLQRDPPRSDSSRPYLKGGHLHESNRGSVAEGAPTAVYLEVGAKRAFASALDWPGWTRSGKDEGLALAALAGAALRYAAVAAEAGLPFPTEVRFDVVERLPGTATTDFGAPDRAAARDAELLNEAEAKRLATLLEAAWRVFDRVVANAPVSLRKGPRGGGRDRDDVVRHVLAAETMYARKLGIRQREPDPSDRPAVNALRQAIARALRESAENPPPVERGWLPRYAARRIAWHVLDHAWEIEDRSEWPP
jgi:hypothetical protein